MISTRVAQRYTRALFELAEEAGQLAEVGSDLQELSRVIQTDESLRTALLSPLLTRSARGQVMAALLDTAQPQPLVARFLVVLLDARKLSCLPDIVSEYQRRADERSGRVHGEAVSALPLADADVAALAKALSSALHKEVLLAPRQDPAVLGGVVAQVGNLVFDGSLRTQLQRMKDNLIKG
ncbi:MAG TPA: ATP synthase F1 subunit delta [Deferrisomatales bacterium]|nr:ATP synthase F1 subunit delta [Deferrisomatales bacterium]